MLRSVLFVGILMGSSGCMLLDAISPEVRLSDVVHRVNDEARWGRIDLAVQEVAAVHRADFLTRHRGWGRDFHIADVDITSIEMHPEGAAIATVVFQWVDERTMELHTTTIRQAWQGEGEGLTSEAVADGDANLLPGATVIAGEEFEIGASAGGEDVAAQVAVRHRDGQGRLVN